MVITPETVGTIKPEHTGTITPLTPKNCGFRWSISFIFPFYYEIYYFLVWFPYRCIVQCKSVDNKPMGYLGIGASGRCSELPGNFFLITYVGRVSQILNGKQCKKSLLLLHIVKNNGFSRKLS